MAAPTLTTTVAPPPRADLHAQIASAAAPQNQVKVADKLQRIAGYLDEVIANTGLPLTLALAPYTPQITTFPLTLRLTSGGRTASVTVRNATDETFYRAQGYS